MSVVSAEPLDPNPEGFEHSFGTVQVTAGKKTVGPGTRNSLGINETFADAALS
jgi:hypothetical protein